MPGWVCQFGMSSDGTLQQRWCSAKIMDDTATYPKVAFIEGTLA